MNVHKPTYHTNLVVLRQCDCVRRARQSDGAEHIPCIVVHVVEHAVGEGNAVSEKKPLAAHLCEVHEYHTHTCVMLDTDICACVGHSDARDAHEGKRRRNRHVAEFILRFSICHNQLV